MKLAVLDLPEGNAMRAPGEAPGLMVLEMAMDELAEKLGDGPGRAARSKNDTQVDPEKPGPDASPQRHIDPNACSTGADPLRLGAAQCKTGARCATGAGWSAWAVAVRRSATISCMRPSAARIRLGSVTARLTVETDMTDIGTGSYTILAQTAAEMMGVPIEQVTVKLGDSELSHVSPGSGGQFGAGNNSTAGRLRRLRQAARGGGATARLQRSDDAVSRRWAGQLSGNRSAKLCAMPREVRSELTAEDKIEYGDARQDSTSNRPSPRTSSRPRSINYTGEITHSAHAGGLRMPDGSSTPKSARSQVIGAMTMGVGAALMEELAVDTRFGFFVNHDLASYEVPVHADIPHQDVDLP